MSTLSKVFVVLNLILSITFAVFVSYFYKHAQNWHAAYDTKKAEMEKTVADLKGEVADRDININGLNNKNGELRRMVSERETEIAKLNTEKSALQMDIQGQKATIETLNNNFTKLENLYAKKNDDARILQDKVNDLQGKIDAAVKAKDQALDAFNEGELKRNECTYLLSQLNEQIHKLSTENNNHQLIFAEMRRKGISIDSYMNVIPTVTGNVIGVKTGVVMVSIGADDGVKEGFVFTVVRGDHYVCNIRIDKVWPDMASGAVVPESLRPEANGQADVQVGDYVSTHL